MTIGLIATVGGTPQPLIETIRNQNPRFICFVCSQQSVDKIAEIKEALRSEGNLSSFTEHKILVNDVNDLMDCYRASRQAVEKIKEWKIKPSDVVVDFTGGTKTMSVAVGLAAILQGYGFSYIGGTQRTKEGIGVVVDGAEILQQFVSPFSFFAVEEYRTVILLFNSYRFSAAQTLIAQVLGRESIESRIKNEFRLLNDLCSAYIEWENFGHKQAQILLIKSLREIKHFNELVENSSLKSLEAQVEKNVDWLRKMSEASGNFKRTTRFHVQDLMANAERRADEGKYDDAVARLYRALEMEGQVALSEEPLQVASASRVAPEKIPESLREEFSAKYQAADGSLKLGLSALFKLLAEVGHPSGLKYRAQEKQLEGILSARNQSILAHGNQPVRGETYEKLKQILQGLIGEGDAPGFPKL